MVDRWMRFEQGGEEDRGFSMRGFCPGDSLWFKGHFPEKGILPGVAMLMLAKEAIRAWADLRGIDVEISGFSRVRFKGLVFPDSTLEVYVTSSEDFSKFHFEIKSEENVVCTGRAGEHQPATQ